MKIHTLESLRDRRRLVLGVGAIVVVTALVALWIINSLGSEYQPSSNLYMAMTLLGWDLVAIIGLGINVWALLGKPRSLSLLMRIVTLASILVLVLAIAGTGLLALYALKQYASGRSAYAAALQRCGHAPLLGDGFTETFITPGRSEYERLKYSIGEDHIFGPDTYFCNEAEAASRGYRADPYQGR